MKRKAAFWLLLVAAMLLSAGGAHADDADRPFLQAVQSKGLAQYFSSPDAQIRKAHDICAGLRTGGNPSSMAFLIARDQNMNKSQVTDFINTSVDFYCADVPHPQI